MTLLPETKFLIDGVENCFSSIHRSTFELKLSLCFEKQLTEMLADLLSSACKQKEQIDGVVLVGGSSRIPKIKKIFTDFFGSDILNHNVNADEAIAHGAAYLAAVLSGHKCIERITIDDVRNSEEIYDPESKRYRYKVNDKFPVDLQNDLSLDRSGIFYQVKYVVADQDHTRSHKLWVNEGMSDSERNDLEMQFMKFQEDEDQLLKCDAAMNDLESCCFQLQNMIETTSLEVNIKCRNSLENQCTEVLSWLDDCNSASLKDCVAMKGDLILTCKSIVERFPHANELKYAFNRILNISEPFSEVVPTTDDSGSLSPDSGIGLESTNSKACPGSIDELSNSSDQKLATTFRSDKHKSDVSASKLNSGDRSATPVQRSTGDRSAASVQRSTGYRSATSVQRSTGDRSATSAQHNAGGDSVSSTEHSTRSQGVLSSQGSTKYSVSSTMGQGVHSSSARGNRTSMGITQNADIAQSFTSPNLPPVPGSNIPLWTKGENVGNRPNRKRDSNITSKTFSIEYKNISSKRSTNDGRNAYNVSKLSDPSFVETSNRYTPIYNLNTFDKNDFLDEYDTHYESKSIPTASNRTTDLTQPQVHNFATPRKPKSPKHSPHRRTGQDVDSSIIQSSPPECGPDGKGSETRVNILDVDEATDKPGSKDKKRNLLRRGWNAFIGWISGEG